MSIKEIVNTLREMPGTTLYDPVDMRVVREVESRLGVCFPESYLQFLSYTNGCEAFWGHRIIYGFDASRAIDVVRWNEPGYWKFAHANNTRPVWFFAGKHCGDQYFFNLSDTKGKSELEVDLAYYVDIFPKEPNRPLWRSFQDFLERLFLRCHPEHDDLMIDCINKVGPLELGKLIAFSPHLLLTPEGTIENQLEPVVMPARSVMILNGDISSMDAPEGAEFLGLENYVDERGLTRTQVLWR